MKRLLLFLFWLSSGYGLINAQSITVTSPNGGETWAGATVQNITWTAVSVTTVNIEYSTDNGVNWTLIVASHPGLSSPYPWTVPGAGPLGSTQCRIRVTSASNSLITDQNNANFSIPASGLTLVYPNGGETFYNGQARSIRWTTQSVLNVDLHYSTDNGGTWNLIASNITANRTFYTWTPPSGIKSSGMRIRVWDNTINTVADLSDAAFTLLPASATDIGKFKGGSFDGYSYDNNRPKTITVNAPNGGEVWSGATTQNITWTSQNVDNVKIEYSSNAGSTWNTIQATYPAGTGTFPWVVPGAGPSGSTSMLVRVSNATNPALNDQSNAYWTIPAAVITLINPNGSENFYNGTLASIRWSSQSVVNMRIEYSTNNGSAWTLIHDSIPAARTFYGWQVPSGINSANCLIRLRDRVDYSIEDVSNATFKILPAAATDIGKFKGGSFDGYAADNSAPKSIVVLTPNGGENWSGSSTQTVSWTSQNVSNVRIEYSTNNGSTWNLVIDPYPAGTGTYTWIVPGAGPSGSTNVLVRVLDAADNTLFDQSNSVWTIPPSSITLLSPVGGEAFYNGTMRPVRWSSQSVIDVRIDYSTNNGSTWTLIAEPIPAARTFYGWTIPSGVNSANCKIRVRDYIDVSVFDITSGVFNILPASSTDIGKFKGGSYDGYATDFGCIEPVAMLSGAHTLCSGSSANLTVTLQNTPPWTLSWSDGQNTFTQSGINTSPYIFSVTPSGNTTYTLTNLAGGCQGVVFGQATTDVINPPSVSLSGNNTIMLGQGTQLSFALSGLGPWNLTYTDGSSLTNVTGIAASPYVVSVSPSTNRTYSPVSVSNYCPGSVSGSAVIQVNSIATAVLSGGQTLCAGSPAQLTVNMSGPSPWTLTWTDGSAQTTVSGLTQSPYFINVSPTVSATYSLVSIVNPNVGNVSGTAIIPVTPLPGVITGLQAGSLSCSTGSWSWNTLPGITAYYADVSTSQTFNTFFHDGNITWQNQLLGNTSSLNLTGLGANTTYYVRVRGNNQCASSPDITGVAGTTIPNPSATLSGAQTLCAGSSANLSVTIQNASPWTLSWSDGQNTFTQTGINTSPYVISVTPSGNTTYTLTSLTGACAGSVSGQATVNISTPPSAILSGSNTIILGQGTQLSFSLSGNSPWNLSYTDGTSLTNVTGIVSSPYVVSVSPSASVTYYPVSVFNTCSGSVLGSAAIQVNALATAVLSGSQTLCAGTPAQLTVNMSGPSPWTLTWTDGSTQTSVSGLTQSPYLIDVTPLASVTYSLVSILNPLTGNISGTAVIPVTPLPGSITGLQVNGAFTCNSGSWSWNTLPGISAYYADVSVSQSFNTFFHDGNITYQNQLLGNTSSLNLTGLSPNTTYYVRVRGNNQCASSPDITGVPGSTIVNPSAIVSSAGTVIGCSGFTANWTLDSLAVNYQLWVGTDSNFISNYQTISTGNNASYQVSGLNENTVYYWKVRGVNVCTNFGPYSMVRQIRTIRLQDSLQISSNSPVCTGTTLNLSVQSNLSGLNYTWSGPSAFSSTLSAPSLNNVGTGESGTYSVSVSRSGCSSVVLSTGVQVNQPVMSLVAGGNLSLCSGETLTLTSDAQMSGVHYSWTGPNGFTADTSRIQINSIDTLGTGVYTIVVTSPGCNQLSDSLNVHVIPTLPVTVSNTGPVCAGNTVYFNVTHVPGSPYSWAGPNGYTSTIQNPAMTRVTPSMSGQYTVTVNQPGCNPLTFMTNLVVSPSGSGVVLTTNSPLCTGGTLGISATNVSGLGYQWSGPGGFTSTSPVISIPSATTLMSGQYSLTIQAPGCGVVNKEIAYMVYPVLTLTAGGNTTLCEGSILYLTSSSHQHATYAWSGPSGFSSSSQNPAISNTLNAQSGIYSLIVNQPGCGTASTTVSVTINPSPLNVAFGSNSPICSGNTLLLSASVVNGWTYAWAGPAGFTSVSASESLPNAGNLQAGIYTLNTSAPGCPSSVRYLPVQISSGLTAVAGVVQTPLCEGQAINLTSTTSPNAQYSWTGPNGFSSTLQNPVISAGSPLNTGVYTLLLTQPGCPSSTSTVSLSVGASLSGLAPVSNSPVCLQGTLQMSSINRSGVTYAWTGPSGFTSNVNNVVRTNVNQSVAGNYILTLSSQGCGSMMYTQKVIVSNPGTMSASSNSPVCGGGVVYLTGMGVTGSTYAWTGPAGFVSSLQSPSLTNVRSSQSGIYTLNMSVPGCGVLSFTTSVLIGENLNSLALATNAPVCINNTLQLSSTTISGATYAWAGPNGYTAATQNVNIPNAGVSEAGVYSLTASTSGCLPLTRMITVNINPALVSLPGNNGPLCQGSALYFTSNSVSGGSYSWSGPNGFVSASPSPSMVNVQPLSSGTYTLTVSSPGCTPVSATTVVQVGGSVNAAVITTNSPVCTGGTLNVGSSAVQGGSFSWTAPDGFTSALQSVSRAGVNSGFAGVYTCVISSPGCGSSTRTFSVVVNNSILSPGSNSPLCQGSALMLSTNSLSGSTYQWTGPSSFVSALQNPSISNAQPVRSGEYTLTVTNNACGIMTATTSVLIGSSLSSIAVTGNTPVCTAGNLNLSVTNRSGYTFAWSGPNGFTSTLVNPVVTNVSGLNAGRYSVVVTSPGCGSSNPFQSAVIVVNNPASVTASANNPVCVGSPVYFTGAAPSGSTYSWSGPASFASALQSPSRSNIQLAHAGVYTMNATVPGCGLVAATVNLTVNPCRMNEVSDVTDTQSEGDLPAAQDEALSGNSENSAESYARLDIWPNPNSGESFMLNWQGLSEVDRTITIRIFDATGKIILLKSVKYDLSGSAQDEVSFPVKLASGVYTIETVHDNRFVYSRMIVE